MLGWIQYLNCPQALCTHTLDEAVDMDNGDLDAFPAALYRVTWEVLDLFWSIVPARHILEIATIPWAAAIIHNDTVYLAREASCLGVDYTLD